MLHGEDGGTTWTLGAGRGDTEPGKAAAMSSVAEPLLRGEDGGKRARSHHDGAVAGRRRARKRDGGEGVRIRKR